MFTNAQGGGNAAGTMWIWDEVKQRGHWQMADGTIESSAYPLKVAEDRVAVGYWVEIQTGLETSEGL